MSQLALIVLIGIAGGAAVALQGPLALLISQGMGLLESIFIIHIGGAVVAGIPLLVLRGGNLGQWQNVPWYALCAGVLGIAVLTAIIYMVPRVGVAASIIIVLSGQLLAGTIVDHFGALGMTEHAMSPTRLIGLAVVFLGVFITVRA